MTDYDQINPFALGSALGIIWGASLLIAGLTTIIWGWPRFMVDMIGQFYIGYNATPLGIILGTLWGFIDFFIFGYLIAWLYNQLS